MINMVDNLKRDIPIPQARLDVLSTRTKHILSRENVALTPSGILSFTSGDYKSIKGVGDLVRDELSKLREECITGSIWDDAKYPRPEDFDNLFDYVAWRVKERNVFRKNDKSRSRWEGTLVNYLGIGDIKTSDRLTLAEVAMQFDISRQAVQVTAEKIIEKIFAGDEDGYFKPFASAILDFFNKKSGVARAEELVDYVKQTFGWMAAVPDGILATLKLLGKNPVRYGELCTGDFDGAKEKQYSDFVMLIDNVDSSGKLEYLDLLDKGLSKEINSMMYDFFVLRALSQKDIKSELARQYFLQKFMPDSVEKRPTALRSDAVLTILKQAGYEGLTEDELFERLNQKCRNLNWTIDGLRGFIHSSPPVVLDGKGSKILKYDRGSADGARSRYSLTTFFMDDVSKRLLEEAAQKIKAYMISSNFGVIDVWKTWDEYRSLMPLYLPKMGFYMMMREIGAGGLAYPKYPRIAYPGIEYTEKAYLWELYRYFTGKGQYALTREECVAFISDKLHVDPLNASANEFSALKLRKKSEQGVLYMLERPMELDNSPKVLISDIKG